MVKKFPLLVVLLSFALLVTAMIISGVSISGVCDVGGGCEVVQTSQYATTMGVPNTYLGLIGFFVLIVLGIMQIRRPQPRVKAHFKHLLTVMSLFALYFIFLQAFVIHAFCTFCMVVDITTLFAAVLFYRLKD